VLSIVADGRHKEEVEMNTQCTICNNGDSNPGNLIVICDGCDTGYHQKCYSGSINLEAQDWFCKDCVAVATTKRKAPLSPASTGTVSPTGEATNPSSEGAWDRDALPQEKSKWHASSSPMSENEFVIN